MVWYSHLIKNIPDCYDPHKGVSIVNETEADVFVMPLLFLWSSRCWQLGLWFSALPACTPRRSQLCAAEA